MTIIIHEIGQFHLKWIQRTLIEKWGSPEIVSRGHIHQAESLNGFMAFRYEKPVGLLTYSMNAGKCEIVTLNAFLPNAGIGTLLINTLKKQMKVEGCFHIWLVTTNDNIDAMCFFQKRGFSFYKVHRNAIKTARKLKPEIPKIGLHGIPIRHEIEMVFRTRIS